MKAVLAFLRATAFASVIGSGVMLAGVNTAKPQTALTLDQRLAAMPSDLAADVRKRLSVPSNAVSPPDRRALPALARPNSERLTATGVTESVAASVRCALGYVVQHRHRASTDDVLIASEALLDCDANGCRAFQVVAKNAGTAPFDLDVSVTCSE